MKVLVACELPPFALDELRSLGNEVIHKPGLAGEALASSLPGVAFLIVGSTAVTAETVNAGRALQMIVRAGTDVSNISVEEASNQGVFVTHTPNRDAVAIAEYMMGMMFVLDRRVTDYAAAGPRRGELEEARGIASRTLGILGFAAVGRELASRARAAQMQVLAWSPTLTPEVAAQHDVSFCTWPRELARRSDVLCVHVPAEAADEVMIDSELLANAPLGAHLIYVGGASALDESAIAEAVSNRKLRLALDIDASESPRDLERLRARFGESRDVLLTQRLASRTQQSRDSTAAEVVRIIREFVVSGAVTNSVNLLERSPATWQLVLRLRDTVGIMAGIMEAVRADGVNAEEITTRVFSGARAAWSTIALDERPSAEAIDAIRRIDGVLHLELRAVV